ncbi:MAG TPA: hypothetical protein VM327_06155 [Candidatus Thermoplasmatota archaeon]|nr:hypothetical protein [Candidatus Thermoplasmatota archaeon]
MSRASVATLVATLVLLLAGCTDGGPDGQDGGTGPGGSMGGSGVVPESGILSGTLTAAGSSTSQPIEIAVEGHQQLTVVLLLTSNVPQTNVGLNVTGPDGRSDEVDTGPILFVMAGNHPAVSFGAPMVGEWTAMVELQSGASADYEVHWCADGAASPGPQDNLACQRA